MKVHMTGGHNSLFRLFLALLFPFSLSPVLPCSHLLAQTTTTLVLLGTGNPFPNESAQGPATAVVVGKRFFLVDAGPGVMRQIHAAGLPISGPEAVFLTHLHFDHTLGLADLILTTWVMRRTQVMPIYGPPGTRQMTDHLIAAYAEDIKIRTEGLEQEVPNGWQVRVTEIQPGVVYDSGGVKVTAIRVLHGSWPYAFGFRFDTPDRTIVISGDTRPSPELEKAAQGVDILVHEVYPEVRLTVEKRPGGADWPKYSHGFHTSDHELGAIAKRANPRLLVLTHIGRMGGTDQEILDGIRAGGFAGNVVVGKDLGRY